MPPRPSRTADLIATADAQRGLVTARQLDELGFPRSTVARRLAGGMWTRVLPGVHLVGGGHPNCEQRLLGALLYAGDGALLTGTCDLRLTGFTSVGPRLPDDPARPEPVHVLIDHERRRKSAGYVRIERTTRMSEGVRVAGYDVAPVARAVADAARRMPRGRDVLALVTEAIQRELTTVDELRRELDEGQMRGSRHLRQAVRAVAEGAHSAPEADLIALLKEAGVPHVMTNVRLVSSRGEFIAVADVWLDDVALALEVDSVQHHAVGEGHARTVRRNARYATLGVPVLTVLPADLRDRPRAILRNVLAAREVAARSPRPDVRVADAGAWIERSAGEPAWPWGA